MDLKQMEELKKHYSELRDDGIRSLLLEGKDSFEPEAFILLSDEAAKRSISLTRTCSEILSKTETEEDESQIQESKHSKNKIQKIIGTILVTGVIVTIYTIFISKEHIEKVTFGVGLATYFLWDGIKK